MKGFWWDKEKMANRIINPIENSEKVKTVDNKIWHWGPLIVWIICGYMGAYSVHIFIRRIFALIVIFIAVKIPKKNSEFLKIKKEDEMKPIYKISKKTELIVKFLRKLAYVLTIICVVDFVFGTGYLAFVLAFLPIAIDCVPEIGISIGKEYLRVGGLYTPISEIIKAEKIIEKQHIKYQLTFKGYLDGSLEIARPYLIEDGESLLDERLSAVEKKRNIKFW